MNDNNNIPQNDNKGLNEFNKRQNQYRQNRNIKRNWTRVAVLVTFLVVFAILVSLLVLIVLSVKDKIEANIPQPPETSTPLDSGTFYDPVQTTSPSQDQTTVPPETTKPVESETTSNQPEPPATETTKPLGGYKTTTKVMVKDKVYVGPLLLINEDHPFNNFNISSSLVEIYDKRNKIEVDGKMNYSLYFQSKFVKVDKMIIHDLLAMTDACYRETKINDLALSTNGAYRTYDEQQDLFDKSLTTLKGGCSDYNSGLSVYFMGYPDNFYHFDDEKYAAGQTLAEWLKQNSYKYGFIKRHDGTKSAITGQKDDIGQYRYVGYPHSYIMKEQDLCLEEYLAVISRYNVNGQHYTVKADDGHTYEIYYVPLAGDVTEVTVPAQNTVPYTISGDNYGGFIVTVTLD